MRHLLDLDPVRRIKRFLWEQDDEIVTETRQDVTDTLDFNQEVRNARLDEGTDGQYGRRVANIPLSVLYGPANPEDLQSPRVVDLPEPEFRRWLNDPGNRAFRTTLERV